MTSILQKHLFRPLASAIALGVALLVGGALLAQPYRGVAPWQAEQVFKDFARDFAAQQVVTSSDSRVRIKISDVRRVYNKDVGWIVVAIFEGGVVPDTASPGQTQTYYHGILKLAADKNGQIQPLVVNEGQGLWKMTALSSQLQIDLPEKVGGWADWGGNPADIQPAAVENATPDTATGTGPTSSGSQGSSSSGGDQDIQALAAEMNAALVKCKKTGDPDDCAHYQKLYQAYNARMNQH